MFAIKEKTNEIYYQNLARHLHLLTHSVLIIKNHLFCSICLEYYKDPVRLLNCDHIYCRKCINTYLEVTNEKEPPCPVCWKNISEHIFEPQPHLITLQQFVILWEHKLQNILNIEDTRHLSSTDIFNSLRNKENIFDIPKTVDTTEFDFSDLLKIHQILITTSNKVLSLDGAISTNSYWMEKIVCKTPQSEKRKCLPVQTLSKSGNIPHTKKDLFEVMKQAQIEDSLCKSTRTYKRDKNQLSTKTNVVTTVEKFEDFSTKMGVIQWLADTRNEFDRTITPEQDIKHNTEYVPDCGLSVSQKQKPLVSTPLVSQINRQKLEQKKIRDKNKTIFEVSCSTSKPLSKRRTRSLECTVRTIQTRSFKRHSIATCQSPEITIEQVHSDEDAVLGGIVKNPDDRTVIVDLMEDVYINKIESELEHNQNAAYKTQNSVRIRKKMPSLLQQTIANANKRFQKTNATSEWDRVKEIKKTMNKTERKTRKLKAGQVLHTSLTGTCSINTNKDLGSLKSNAFLDKTTSRHQTIQSYNLGTIDNHHSSSTKNRKQIKSKDSIASTSGNYTKTKLRGSKDVVNLKVVDSVGKRTLKQKLAQTKKVRTGNTIKTVADQIKKVRKISENDECIENIDILNLVRDNEETNYNTRVFVKSNIINENIENTVAITKKQSAVVKNIEICKSKEKCIKANNENQAISNANQDISIIKHNYTASVSENKNSKAANKGNAKEVVINLVRLPLDDKSDTYESHNTMFKGIQSITNKKNLNSNIKSKVHSLETACNESTIKKLLIDTEENTVGSVVDNTLKILNEIEVLEPNIEVVPTINSKKNLVTLCKEKNQANVEEHLQDNITPAIIKNIGDSDTCYDDEIFMIPTQLNQPLLQKKEHTIEQYDDDDDIFFVATQAHCINKPSLNIENVDLTKMEITEKVSLLKQVLNDFKIDCLIQPEKQLRLLTCFNIILNDIDTQIQRIPKFCKTKDIDVQTNDSTEIFSLSVSTQTANSVKHIAIQTDPDSPRGFHISSSAVFNIPIGVSAEVQTEPMQCAKCSDKSPIPNILTDQKFKQKLSAKYTFSETFDNIDFDTQEAIKSRFGMSSDSKEMETGIANKCLSLKSLEQPTAGMRKTYKRIRNPSLSEESDIIEKVPMKTKKNRFMDENLSIYFESENQNEVLENDNYKNDAKFTLTKESDEMNYAELLEGIIQRCDDGIVTNSKIDNQVSTSKRFASQDNITSNVDQPCSKKLKTQDIIKECEMIIKKAWSELLILEDTPQCTLKESSKLTMAVLEREFENSYSGSINKDEEEIDVAKFDLPKTHSRSKTKNKFSESLFTDDNLYHIEHANNKTGAKLNLSKENINELIEKFNKTVDFFDENLDAEVASINIKHNIDANKQVNVLQDVVIVPYKNHERGGISPLPIVDCIKVRNENTPKCDRPKTDDVFDSDSEVVESTPEKNKITSLEEIALHPQDKIHTQGLQQKMAVGEDVFTSLNTDFTKPFTPPPEFQDLVDENSMQQNSEAQMVSLTPDLTFPQNIRVSQTTGKKDPLRTSTPFTQPSQILSTYSLNLSPIKQLSENSNMNPLQAAQHSKASPLTIIGNQTPKSHRVSLRTSTPKQKSILQYTKQYKPLNTSQLSQTSKKPCVAYTRLSKDQVMTIASLFNKHLITFSNVFSSSVTHMIVCTNEKLCIQDHTMKFILAIASGIWVLSFSWVEECLKQGQIVREEPHEALDLSGIPGPQKSRLSRLTNPLLRNFKIYVAMPFVSATQDEVENVIVGLGGEIVSRPDDLLSKNGKNCLIITEARDSQDSELYQTWLETLGVVTVDLEWLSRSVAQYQLQSLRPYSLCSEDSMCNLKYPPELLVEVSFSQTLSSL